MKINTDSNNIIEDPLSRKNSISAGLENNFNMMSIVRKNIGNLPTPTQNGLTNTSANVINTNMGNPNNTPTTPTVKQEKNTVEPFSYKTSTINELGSDKLNKEERDIGKGDNDENRPLMNRKRSRATPEQLAILEATFEKNTSPNSKLREVLAEKVHMSERSIQIWFQNRRAKVKNTQKRAQQAILQEQAYRSQFYMHQMSGGLYNGYNPYAQQPMYPPGQFPPKLLNRSKSIDGSMFSQQPLNTVPEGCAAPATATLQNQMINPLAAGATGLHTPTGTPVSPIHAMNIPMADYSNPAAVTATANHPLTQNISLMKTTPTEMNGSINPPTGASATTPATAMNAVSYSLLNGPDKNYFNFTCNALVIGEWRRISIHPNSLICSFSYIEKQLKWQIKEQNIRFKLEFPFTSVSQITLELGKGRLGKLIFTLNKVPTFWMETNAPPNSVWNLSGDFTENKQASKVFRHILEGPYENLRFELLTILQHIPELQTITQIQKDNTNLIYQQQQQQQNNLFQRRQSCPAGLLFNNNQYARRLSIPTTSTLVPGLIQNNIMINNMANMNNMNNIALAQQQQQLENAQVLQAQINSAGTTFNNGGFIAPQPVNQTIIQKFNTGNANNITLNTAASPTTNTATPTTTTIQMTQAQVQPTQLQSQQALINQTNLTIQKTISNNTTIPTATTTTTTTTSTLQSPNAAPQTGLQQSPVVNVQQLQIQTTNQQQQPPQLPSQTTQDLQMDMSQDQLLNQTVLPSDTTLVNNNLMNQIGMKPGANDVLLLNDSTVNTNDLLNNTNTVMSNNSINGMNNMTKSNVLLENLNIMNGSQLTSGQDQFTLLTPDGSNPDNTLLNNTFNGVNGLTNNNLSLQPNDTLGFGLDDNQLLFGIQNLDRNYL